VDVFADYGPRSMTGVLEQPDWGPGFDCPRCGALVQYYLGKRRRFPTLMDGGTMMRHSCWQPEDVHVPEARECLCGKLVWLAFDGGYVDHETGEPHVCKHHRPAGRSILPAWLLYARAERAKPEPERPKPARQTVQPGVLAI
jgi:hypothetical protein